MKSLSTLLLLLFFVHSYGQDSTLVLSAKMFDENNTLQLAEKGQWVFKNGNDLSWADPNINTTDWDTLRPVDLNADMADENGRLEGWFRLKIKLDSSLEDSLTGMGLISEVWAASDVYINGKLFHSFGNTGINNQPFKAYNSRDKLPTFHELLTDKEYLIAIHFVDKTDSYYWHKPLRSQLTLASFLTITTPYYLNQKTDETIQNKGLIIGISVFLLALVLLFWLIYFQNKKEKHLLMIALTVSFILLSFFYIPQFTSSSFRLTSFLISLARFFFILFFIIAPFTVGVILNRRISKVHWLIASLLLVVVFISSYINFHSRLMIMSLVISSPLISAYYIIVARKTIKGARWSVVIGLILPVSYFLLFRTFDLLPRHFSLIFELTAFPLSLLVYVSMWFKESRQAVEINAEKVIKITEEKKNLLANQNILLEQQVNERTAELNQSLENLKTTQTQLIHSEKMASLGELTAGIAHEIQNPLNFVNNFSDVSVDLVEELNEELSEGNTEEVKSISQDLKQNLEKIHHHGERASSIVKGMLEHSRAGNDKKQPTDINAMADEYIRLAYHGIRAKDNSFNADFEAILDKNISKINVVGQDIARVVLNLINNAFHACAERSRSAVSPKSSQTNCPHFKPRVTIETRNMNDHIEIRVKDNGFGIPDEIIDKIFQPFFTTKASGEGTGLGLSLSYDIITKGHGGELKVETIKNEGTEFIINIPIITD